MEDKSSNSITGEAQCIVGETSKLSMDKRHEDLESRRIGEATELLMNKCQENSEQRDTRTSLSGKIKMENTELQGSPELRRKLSITIAAREDARRLKTATLDRMGKMFKLKSNRATDEAEGNALEKSKGSLEDQQSRREKTNSLGRMLKLVDKNGEPRKLFNTSRSGSLSHMFRRKSTGTHENENSTEISNNAGVFSRILNQWRNRSRSGNSTGEPNLCASFPEENKSLSSKPSSASKLNLSSTCTFPTSDHPATTSSVVKSADIEYPA